MTMNYEEMWKEIKEWCQRAEKELLEISEKYEVNTSEKKRVQGKADGVSTVLQNMIRLENLNETPIFYRVVKDEDDIFTLDEFLDQCQSGMFVNSDGSGSYSKNGFIYWEDAVPSDFISGRINRDYTHVVWFNK